MRVTTSPACSAGGGHPALHRWVAVAWIAAAAAAAGCDRAGGPVIELATEDTPVRVVLESHAWDAVPGPRRARDQQPPPIELAGGFDAPSEEAGRAGAWATATEARLRFTVIEPRERRLELHLSPAPVPRGEVQTLAVLAGAKPLTAAPIRLERGEQLVSVNVGADALPAGHPEVTLRFAFASRPADVVPGAGDPRNLAARIQRIRLRGTGGAAGQANLYALPKVADRAWTIRAPALLRFPLEVPGGSRFEAELVSGDGAGGARAAVWLERDGEAATRLIDETAAAPEKRSIGAPIPAGGEALGLVEVRVTGPLGAEVRLANPRVVLPRGSTPRFAAAPQRAGASTGAAEPAPAARHVILAILDAASALHSSAYGYARPTTPVLEAIAREGVLFERAYAPAAYTIASSATMLTGLSPERHGVYLREARLGENVPTIAGAFQRLGARTCAIVANPSAGQSFGVLREFDEVQEVFRDPTTVMDPEIPRPRHMIPEVLNELAVSFLSRDPATPGFVYLHQVPPHHPYLAPPPFRGQFPSGEPRDLIETWNSISPRVQVGLARWEREFARDRYDEHFRYADDGVAKLIERLREAGLDDDTLLVVTADHGEAFGQHGRIFHNTTVYEEMVRVPLVVRAPRAWRVAPHRVATPVSTGDLLATLTALAGARGSPERTIDPGSEGIDLSAAIRSNAEPPARLLTSRSIESFRRQALVDGTWKYIDDQKEGDLELYDLLADPKERTNLASARPVRTAYLGTRLEVILAKRRSGAFATGRVDLDGTAKESLKALGYAGE